MILVTGANGLTGRAVVHELAAAGERVRAFDIAPEVTELETLDGVEAFIGDLADAGDVRRAMDGVRIVVYIGPPLDPREGHMGHTAISEARAAGVEHFVYFSIAHPQLQSMPMHEVKLEVERRLLMSRLPYTVLQPTYYMQNVDVADAVRCGVLRQPFAVETKVAHVDLRNVATIVGQVVAAPTSHAYATYQLCGGDLRSGPRAGRGDRGRIRAAGAGGALEDGGRHRGGPGLQRVGGLPCRRSDPPPRPLRALRPAGQRQRAHLAAGAEADELPRVRAAVPGRVDGDACSLISS